jgi:hypothetical protein
MEQRLIKRGRTAAELTQRSSTFVQDHRFNALT